MDYGIWSLSVVVVVSNLTDLMNNMYIILNNQVNTSSLKLGYVKILTLQSGL